MAALKRKYNIQVKNLGWFPKGVKQPTRANTIGGGIIPWNKGTKGKVKPNSGSFQKRMTPEERKLGIKRSWLKYRYGITLEQYEQMFVNQNNCCALCKNKFTRTPHIDHDHRTGKIRGLLCIHCNHILGFAEDNIELMHRAINYLEKNK